MKWGAKDGFVESGFPQPSFDFPALNSAQQAHMASASVYWAVSQILISISALR